MERLEEIRDGQLIDDQTNTEISGERGIHMGIVHTDIADIELNSGTVHRSFAQKTLGEGDKKANRYGIRLWRNGEPVDVGGSTCMGFFIPHADGDTVTINGGLFSGQEAFVELPEACYAHEGGFTLVIKLVDGDVTGTMRIIDGTVMDTMIGSPIDPGGVIPDLEDLLEVIERAEDAAETIAGISVYAQQVEGDNYAIVVNTGGGS